MTEGTTLAQEAAVQCDAIANAAGRLNRQLYENSALSGSQVEQEALSDPERLYNRKLPNLAVLHEKPEHRIMLHLKARGYSNREVAQLMGFTDAWVSQVMRQPWAQKYLMGLLTEAGKDAVQELLKNEMANSVLTLVEVRDSVEAAPAARVSAANALLDRFFGKPKVSVEQVNTNINTDASLTELDARLAELRAQERQIFSLASQVPSNG